MTKEGYESLMRECENLKRVDRPQIVKEIAAAREHGDLSENAEYDAAKEKQGLIEGRIKDLENKLANAQLVDISEAKPGTVVFGATVCLEDADSGSRVTYKIVGADLIGRQIGDTVEVTIPAGEKEYTILDISFN
jgi:transcription elongation factor GreA